MVVDVSTGYLAEDNRLGPRVALVVTATVSFIIVCLRLYARGIIAKQLGLDDYTMVAAWVSRCAWSTRKAVQRLARVNAWANL